MATMITVLALMMPVVWFRMQSPVKKRILALLAWTFAGALLALLVMAFSPAISITIQDSPPGVVKLFMDSFLFSYLFILDTVKILPSPTVVSVLIPALLVWLYKQARPSEFTQTQRRFVWIVFIASPFLMGLLIAAGFSPSVYGQGYPVERMRFLARALMTAALMLEGALIGLLLQNWQFKSNRYFGQVMGAVLFSAIAIIYPLRAVINVYGAVPEYRTRATLWDLREAYILRRINKGRTNLVIPEFPGVYGIKELDAQKDHWINKCAAAYYGVNSIRTVPVLDEDLHAILNK